MAYVLDSGRPHQITELPREMLFAAPALSLAMAGWGGWAELAPLTRFGIPANDRQVLPCKLALTLLPEALWWGRKAAWRDGNHARKALLAPLLAVPLLAHVGLAPCRYCRCRKGSVLLHPVFALGACRVPGRAPAVATDTRELACCCVFASGCSCSALLGNAFLGLNQAILAEPSSLGQLSRQLRMQILILVESQIESRKTTTPNPPFLSLVCDSEVGSAQEEVEECGCWEGGHGGAGAGGQVKAPLGAIRKFDMGSVSGLFEDA